MRKNFVLSSEHAVNTRCNQWKKSHETSDNIAVLSHEYDQFKHRSWEPIMHQKLSTADRKLSSKFARRVDITEDLICLMEGFTIAAMNEKPDRENLVDFAASYFEEILKKRNMLADKGVSNFRTGLYLSKEWNGEV